MVIKNKFIFYELTAIIEDYMNYSFAIDEWLEAHDCKRTGMVIKFCDDKTKMMFMLRWS
jgi:hypothetical protein